MALCPVSYLDKYYAGVLLSSMPPLLTPAERQHWFPILIGKEKHKTSENIVLLSPLKDGYGEVSWKAMTERFLISILKNKDNFLVENTLETSCVFVATVVWILNVPQRLMC
jgi:hypothetical protein